MSESTHTPGPWTIEREHGDRVLRAPDGTALMCDMQFYPWVPDSEADWNLIAAAPEMLEALMDCMKFVPQGHWARDEAEAVIKKARGSNV